MDSILQLLTCLNIFTDIYTLGLVRATLNNKAIHVSIENICNFFLLLFSKSMSND